MTFSTFSLDQRINAGIKACGYETPTPIQDQAIPLILEGHDVMGLAQTGTGKTAAFALPILQRLLESKKATQAIPRVLVLAPTRELALQINQNFRDLGKQDPCPQRCGHRRCGHESSDQGLQHLSGHRGLPRPSLSVLMSKGAVNLHHIDTLVLDEADRMA